MHGALFAKASAAVEPNRIVKITGEFTVAHAGANEVGIGVSMPLSRSYNDVTHADTGEQIAVDTIVGSVVRVEFGGTVSAGAFVKSDANGKAVAAATTGTTAQNIVGQAVEAGADGRIGLIRLQPQTLAYPALS